MMRFPENIPLKHLSLGIKLQYGIKHTVLFEPIKLVKIATSSTINGEGKE